VRDASGYRMWYAGFDGSNWRIGLATSPDGIVWTRYAGNPVLNLGPANAWDQSDVRWLYVQPGGLSYRMWYTGYSGDTMRIGYAESANGISWIRNTDNPATDYLRPGRWGYAKQYSPMVLQQGDRYRMWYSELDGGIYSRGAGRGRAGGPMRVCSASKACVPLSAAVSMTEASAA